MKIKLKSRILKKIKIIRKNTNWLKKYLKLIQRHLKWSEKTISIENSKYFQISFKPNKHFR